MVFMDCYYEIPTFSTVLSTPKDIQETIIVDAMNPASEIGPRK